MFTSHTSLFEVMPPPVQPTASDVRPGAHLGSLIGAASLKLPADAMLGAVMPRRLDEQPAGMPVPGFGDRAAGVFLAGLMLRRHQPEIRPGGARISVYAWQAVACRDRDGRRSRLGAIPTGAARKNCEQTANARWTIRSPSRGPAIRRKRHVVASGEVWATSAKPSRRNLPISARSATGRRSSSARIARRSSSGRSTRLLIAMSSKMNVRAGARACLRLSGSSAAAVWRHVCRRVRVGQGAMARGLRADLQWPTGSSARAHAQAQRPRLRSAQGTWPRHRSTLGARTGTPGTNPPSGIRIA